MAQSESQKKQRDRRKKRKREKEDQNQQEEEKDGNGGEDEVLRRDPFEVFGRDIMLKILRNLDARSVALSLLVSRGWHSVASSDRLWSSKCEELWLGKAHIPRLSQIRGLSKLAAYSLSVMDGKRTRIMKDDLCDHVWEFHFNELHGAWASPFSCRVVWALKLKGIPYENIEEDLPNKSKLILQYNPVHKKIPVLVHGRKPICESMIIIEYIDETWPQNPLLPSDPYQRALARFWVKFAEDKGFAVWTLFRSSGEEQEKAKNESLESLRTIEEHRLGNKKFFGGEEIGIVDIAFGWMSLWLGIIEEIVGVKLLEAHLFPRLYAWTKNFKEVPVIKQNLPDCHELLLLFKGVREQPLGSSSSSS